MDMMEETMYGEEMSSDTIEVDGIEAAEDALEIFPDDDCDTRILDRKSKNGTVIPSLQNMPPRHTPHVSNNDHMEEKKEHANNGDGVPATTSQRPNVDMIGKNSELSHDTLEIPNTDTTVEDKIAMRGDNISAVMPAETVELLGSSGSHDLDEIFTTAKEDKSSSDVYKINMLKADVISNPDLNEIDESGYTPFCKAALNSYHSNGFSPRHARSKEDHVEVDDSLKLQETEVNVKCNLDRTPRHTGASKGYSFTAEGTNVNKTDVKSCRPIHLAVQYGRLDAVKRIVRKRTERLTRNGVAMLHTAAESGHLNIVKFLVLEGVDVNEENGKGMIPLHGAASWGHKEVMEYLVQQGCDVNKGDAKGWTPFNAAVQNGHLEAVKYLLTKGAKQNNYNGMTPVYAASRFGHLDIVQFLISYGADMNEESKRGQVPLHGAATGGHTKVIEYLIKRGSEINRCDAKGWTPFYAAVQNGHLGAVKYLLNQGAKKNRCDGKTALYCGALHGHLDIVKFLISDGADVNEENERGMIPLHGAAVRGHIEVMEYLIQQGSDVNKGEVNGWTPFNAAVQNGHLEAVKYLTFRGTKQNIYTGMTPMYFAALCGHLDIVRFFISNGADVNEEDGKGMIPLHGAAARGHIEVLEYLIQQGSDVNKGDERGSTPFNAAVQNGHLGVVKYLLTTGAKQNKDTGMTPLYVAALCGHLDILRFFVSKGADVNEEDEKGMIPLHGAAARGHINVMEYLIQRGSDVNKCDASGRTPFIAAAQNGNLETVKYLEAKAVEQNKSNGITPLYAAARLGDLDCVEFLVSEGADVNGEDDEGMIPLHAAAIKGDVEMMKYLIKRGSDLSKKDNTGLTPLHAAVQNGHLESVKLLLANGALLSTFDGLTPLNIATMFDHTDVVKFLVAKRCDVNERSECGRSPLHAACYNGNIDVVKCLLDHNANVKEQDEDGWTPLHAAAQEGHRDVVEFLTLSGGDIASEDIDGWTPLHAAAKEGYCDVVEFLALNGADITAKDIDGMTPTQAAKQGGHTKVAEYLTQRGRDTEDTDISDPSFGSYQRYHQRHHASSKFEALQRDEDRYDREGRTPTKSPAKRFDPEHPHDAVTVDSMDGSPAEADENGITSIHNKYQHTMPPLAEHWEKDELNPFVSARIKCPGKTVTTAEQKQFTGSMKAERESCAVRHHLGNICPAQYNRSTHGFTKNTDNNAFPLLNGSPTWKFGDFDQSFLHTTKTNSHPNEEMEPRWHTILEEPISPMNARNNQPTTENEETFESSILTDPVAEDHHKLKEGNPFSTKCSFNSGCKTKKKRRTADRPCSSFHVLVKSFLHMIIALAILLARGPVLVAGSVSTERVTLQAGKTAVIPFNLTWSSSGGSSFDPIYTLRFDSKTRPFCINGHLDLEGFKSPSQFPRFRVSVEGLASSLCLNLFIESVDTLDEDMYELVVIQHDFQDVLYEYFRKEVLVQIPPGPAKCFITKSENNNYPYEVHCEATTGSIKTTLTCYQYGQRVEVKGEIIDNGHVTRGVFLLSNDPRFSCCSHGITLNGNEAMCNDFEWPPSRKITTQGIKTTSRAINSRPIKKHDEATDIPEIESQTRSGASGKFMSGFVWCFMYLLIYLSAFVAL